MRIFHEPIGFEWDAGNREKNLKKHRVTDAECEEVFFDPHKRMVGAPVSVGTETRHLLIGQTRQGRALFVVFAVRREKVRIISARDLNQKERRFLE